VIALGSADTPCPVPAPNQGTAALTGTAIGYALASHFGAPAGADVPAELGATWLDRRLVRARRRLPWFRRLRKFTTAHAIFEEAEARLRAISSDEPGYWRELAVACAVLGRLEQAFRAGPRVDQYTRDVILLARGGLDAVAPRLVDATALADLARLAELAARDFVGIFERRGLVFAPVFEQSAGLGGADGDFVVERALVEIKCTAPARVISGRDLHQVAGYVLADTGDRLGIREVVLVAPRWRRSVALPVTELLKAMAPPAGLSGRPPTLAEWRSDFAASVAALNRRRCAAA
jgi:hypothetical protein